MVLWRHAQRPVQANHRSIEHLILGNLHDERGKFIRVAQAGGKGNLPAKRRAHLLRQTRQQGRLKEAWRNRHDADAVAGEIPGKREGHPHHPALRCSIGDLPHLTVIRGNRGSADDQAPLPRREGRLLGHLCRGEPGNVECPY